MPTPAVRPPGAFTCASLLLFVAGAVVLRLLTIAGWMFFPGTGAGPQTARIVIPLLFCGALVALNQRMLARDGFPADALGLHLTRARIAGFIGGALAMALVVAAMGAVLGLLVPFHYGRGPLSWTKLGLQAFEYLGGNTAEELVFRGYLLLLLIRHLGVAAALAITGLLFGLFHLPGLSGLAALKMVATTFVGGTLFAYGFLLTRSLWTSFGLHVVGNLVLHQVLGLSGQPSMFTPLPDAPWPADYDPAFVAWCVVCIPLVVVAALVHRRRKTAADSPET